MTWNKKAGKQISCLFRQKETRHDTSAESQPAEIFIHKETGEPLATGGICCYDLHEDDKKSYENCL